MQTCYGMHFESEESEKIKLSVISLKLLFASPSLSPSFPPLSPSLTLSTNHQYQPPSTNPQSTGHPVPATHHPVTQRHLTSSSARLRLSRSTLLPALYSYRNLPATRLRRSPFLFAIRNFP